MKINQQFQDLHLANKSTDWVLKQNIERDICLLYKQLSDYSHIMSDLYYGDVFSLSYWEYLSFPGLPPEEEQFIREGCLIMILAMAWEIIDGAGAYLQPYLSLCQKNVSELACTEERTKKLCRAVDLALACAEAKKSETTELVELSSWAHTAIVQGYFRRAVYDFDNNPYFKNA